MEKTDKNHIINNQKILFKELLEYCNTSEFDYGKEENLQGTFEVPYFGNWDTYHFKNNKNHIKYWMKSSEFIFLVREISAYTGNSLRSFKKIKISYVPSLKEGKTIIKFKLKQ